MAYNLHDFMVGRGSVNCEANLLAPAYHSYTTKDTLATVMSDFYFPSNFGFGNASVLDNDIIWIHTLDNRGFFTVRNSSTDPILSANITPPNLDVTGGGSLNFSGPFAGSQTVFYNYVMNATQITLTFEPLTVASNATGLINSTNFLPASITPESSIYSSLNVINVSINAPGYMVITAAGQVIFATYQASNIFTSGNVGWNRSPFTYQLPNA